MHEITESKKHGPSLSHRWILLLVAIFVLTFSAIAYLVFRSMTRPEWRTLTILVDGTPAANVSVSDVMAGREYVTDATGTIDLIGIADGEHLLTIQKPVGQPTTFSYKPPSQMTIDFRPQRTIATTIDREWLLIPVSQTNEWKKLTPDEVNAIQRDD